jgi:hypothetical protein
MSDQTVAPIPRLALSREEAAAALGMGLTMFSERVQPDLRVVRVGSKVLIPTAELQRWVGENAERTVKQSNDKKEVA